jgi:TrmH family RNA methyltransferase
MIERITGRSGATYKSWQAISKPRAGKQTGLVFLEGLRLCADAIESKADVESCLLADDATVDARLFFDRLPESVRRYTLPDPLFASLCETEHPQGLALICRSPVLDQPQEKPRADGLYLIAEAIQDPGNLGTMIRTADAFAFDGVIVTSGTVSPINGKTLRAAMGSCFHIPLLSFPDLASVSQWLSLADLPMIAADARGQETSRADWPVAAALLIGNEARGISAEARALCKHMVRIPMPGRAESLNASAAAAILGYELMLARSSSGHD